jgi:hemerythrin-like domain-containing protein
MVKKEEEKISTFMLKEHGKILSLLNDFNKSRTEENFQRLKKKQEDHMVAEEKAIFIFYKEKKKFPLLIKIMQQHEQIEEQMNEIEHNILQNSENYKKLMEEHIILEDKEFYPKLDTELTPLEKTKMLKETKEYILGNIGFV